MQGLFFVEAVKAYVINQLLIYPRDENGFGWCDGHYGSGVGGE